MRAAHTAGVVNTLLDNHLYFRDVFGISAGSSHTVNYISRDTTRARGSFVEFMALPEAAGMQHFLRGRGFFNAHYIYQCAGLPDGPLPFNLTAFMESPSRMHIDGFNVDTNTTAHWTKDDIHTLKDLMTRVQASSTMPFFMPVVHLDGQHYYDGGLGDSWGILLEHAEELGYQRFFVVRTQERGYRKKPPRPAWLSYLITLGYPQVAQRMSTRWKHYNAICDRLEQLEAEGRALVYHPKTMPITNTCIDLAKLQKVYEDGYTQAHQELPKWKEFLGI